MEIKHIERWLVAGTLVILVAIAGIVAFERLGDTPDILESTEPVVKVATVPGMKLKKLVVNKNGTMLPVSFKSTAWCNEGDLNIIQRELNRSEVKRLIVSVEPLFPGGEDFKPITKELTVKDITRGREVSFVLPTVNKPKHLAIYFCKDSSMQNSCANKKFGGYNDLHFDYGHSETKPSEAAEDRIYFFSYLLLGHNWVGAIDNQMVETGYDQLGEYLAEKQIPDAVIPTVVKRVQELNKKMGSISLDLTNESIAVDLPRLDMERCSRRIRRDK